MAYTRTVRDAAMKVDEYAAKAIERIGWSDGSSDTYAQLAQAYAELAKAFAEG